MPTKVLLQVTFDEEIDQGEAEQRVEIAFLFAEIPPTWDNLEIVDVAFCVKKRL